MFSFYCLKFYIFTEFDRRRLSAPTKTQQHIYVLVQSQKIHQYLSFVMFYDACNNEA